MLGKYAESKNLGIAAGIIVVLCLIVMLLQLGTFKSHKQELHSDSGVVKAGVAMGTVAYGEAEKILGSQGGKVVVIVYGMGIGKLLPGTLGESFYSGFQKARSKESNIQVLGYYLAESPSRHNRYQDSTQPTLEILQAARQQFPQVDLLVSQIGVPQFSESQVGQWKAGSPPAMITFDIVGSSTERMNLLMQAGILRTCWMKRDPHQFPTSSDNDQTPEQVVDSLYEVHRH